MVRVPKHTCDLLGNSFHGHPLPSRPADVLGELSSLLNLPSPCHSPRVNSAFQPFHQHPSSSGSPWEASGSLHKCSANLQPPTAGPTVSVVIKNRSCCSRPSCWALICSRPGEHEPLSFNSTSVSCTSSSRADRRGCQSLFFLLLLTESFESRSTSPARSLNDSPVILPLKKRAHK